MRILLFLICLGVCTASTAQKAARQPVVVYWIANDDGHIPSECEFRSCGASASIEHGQRAIAFDVRTLTTDRFIFFAEPITEPAKTSKFSGASDYEILGPNGQISAPARLGTTALRYYRSNAPTSNRNNSIQLIAE